MAKIIVLFSTKGGTGKTLIAGNLAVSLAKDLGRKVCLLDLDLHVVGDMAKVLDLNPQKTVVDLIQHVRKHPEAPLKKENFTTKSNFGFDFLPAILKPQQAPHLTPDMVRDALKLLEKDYDYIIIDAGKGFTDIFVTTINLSNLILLIVTPDVLSIYQTKWALDTLAYLHFPLAMVKVILNRADSVSSISWQEVRFSIAVDILESVPSEGKAVIQAINQGIPVVIDAPKTRVALALKKVAQVLDTDDKLFYKHRELGDIKVKEESAQKDVSFWQSQGLVAPVSQDVSPDEVDEIIILKRRIHNRLIDELNLKKLDLKVFSDFKKTQELKDKAAIMVTNFLTEEAGSFISSQDVRRKIVKEIIDEALGLGPLEDLLADPTVTDIMVNNKDEIYVERHGKIEPTNKRFISNDQVRVIIERIIAPLGRRIDESVPMVDARLQDGSRVNAIIPPLSLAGPAMTIRKFRKERYKTEELITLNTLNQQMADFIRACVISRKNIIVSGGTGSGKTTVLNILSAYIPDNERILTLEDAAELKLSQEHWLRLESRPPNIEGRGAVTIRDLFRNTLRMRPDRIIVGECRGVETLDMLQAMNTGHDGSMTTVHANSTHDVLSRLDSMILMSGIELPIRAIREMIASAIDIIVHTARLTDGKRKVMQITELAGMQDDMHIDLRDIFMFKQSGIDKQGNVLGEFQATGYIPSFMDEIKIRGIPLPEDVFKAPI